MDTPAETQQGFAELRKGIISLAVMLNLRHENHGYAVRIALSRIGLPLKEGTLYPLLRRLEAQGILTGRWDTTGDRMRKFYSLTQSGSETLVLLQRQWGLLVEIVRAMGEEA